MLRIHIYFCTSYFYLIFPLTISRSIRYARADFLLSLLALGDFISFICHLRKSFTECSFFCACNMGPRAIEEWSKETLVETTCNYKPKRSRCFKTKLVCAEHELTREK